jgi:uncharacterized phage protein (TIGR01671 family)
MREIKVRAWDKCSKRMLYTDLHDPWWYSTARMDNDHAVITKRPENVMNYILMEYTPLKDKNGVEICEEDYFKAFSHVYKIVFVEKLACFQMFNQNKEMLNDSGFIMNMNGEVIGNKYENPELKTLKGGK